MELPHIVVEAHAGYKGEETPRAFVLKGAWVTVGKIIERWYTETHSYFRVSAADTKRYVLRYHLDEGIWELVMEEQESEK